MGSRLRIRAETLQNLREQWEHAQRIGGLAAIKRLRTAAGIKDTFQSHFIEKLTNVSRLRGNSREVKEQDMNRLLSSFPQDMEHCLSPVWRIKGELALVARPLNHI